MKNQYMVYVISLTDKSGRLENITHRLNNLNLSEFKVIKAVDGRSMTDEQINTSYAAKKAINRSGRQFSRGEIGCALSHQKAYRTLLESPYPWSLVLEDDATFKQELTLILSELKSWLDADAPRVVLLTPLRAFIDKKSEPVVDGYRRVEIIKAWCGTGYALNRAAAKLLIQENSRVQLMADDWISYRQRTEISLMGLDPWVIREDSSETSTLELVRGKKRKDMDRTMTYRINKFRSNILYVLLKWLWWKPFFGYKRH